jgi:SH3-like domain-containing protein
MSNITALKAQKLCSFVFCLMSLVLISVASSAQNTGPIPRFVSLSSDEVFLRVGPGKQYPIKWVYRQEGYPVEIIREFEHWRKVRDRDGYEGWLHKGLISGKRTAIVTGGDPEQTIWLMRHDNSDSKKIARVEINALVYLNECGATLCNVSAQGITGWIERKYLWGIYDQEIIE